MTDAQFFAKLLPELARLARIHRERCAAAGLHIVFTAGWRSPTEQMSLFAKGRRLTDKGWVVIDAARVVTHAMPEQAPHCRGAAYDCAPVDASEKIDWNRIDLFQAVATFAPTPLVWGGAWAKLKDMPHYELPNWRGMPLKS